MEDDQVKHYFIRGLSSSLFTKVRNSDKTLGEILNKLIKIGDDEETPPGVCGIMDMVCSYCNKTNHTISNCFLKKGDMNKGIIRERHPSHPGSPQHNPNHKKVGKVIKKVVFKPKQFKKRHQTKNLYNEGKQNQTSNISSGSGPDTSYNNWL
ncbi:hypothetical protein HMI54_012227 [Coelomomyces lativittatus]|nr:hypothetical protein HMI54_012227 [Coelomomyces lativittatus]